LDDGGRDAPKPISESAKTKRNLQNAANEDHHPKNGEAVLSDSIRYDDSKSRRRSAHLQRNSSANADDNSTDDSSEQPRRDRDA
jgi:hypothetical protein